MAKALWGAAAAIVGALVVFALMSQVPQGSTSIVYGVSKNPDYQPKASDNSPEVVRVNVGGINTFGGAIFDPSEKPFIMSEAIQERNYDESAILARVHEKVNELRDIQKVPPLMVDEQLATIAKTHSMDMSERDFFDHVNPDGNNPADRARLANYDCAISENIAMLWVFESYTYDPYTGEPLSFDWITNEEMGDQIFMLWYDSVSHRLNMYTASHEKEGLGMYIDQYGRVFVTQNFC